MADISLAGVTKVFGENTVVDDLTLEIADGEFMALVGPSGCGKTTALRMVAGLEEVSSGTLSIGGKVVNNVLPKDRDIAMVFQNYALYPHMSVAQNVGFALKIRGVPKAEIAIRVSEAAGILQLTKYLDRLPKALSGGQRQRVAMGRAIVRSPQAFLMDEPLSNLDAQLRVEMRLEIARIQRMLGVATVYVTHDQVEAMTMGDRVAVMRAGKLQQVGTPQEVYDRPASEFVAGFMGSPPMNLLQTKLVRKGDGVAITLGEQLIELPASYATSHDLAFKEHRDVVLGIRPEDIEVLANASVSDGLMTKVERVEALGSETLVHLSIPESPDGRATPDDHDNLLARPTRLVARLGARTPVSTSGMLVVRLSPDRLHFFDAETGLNVRLGGTA